MHVKVRASLAAGGLAGLLALGAVACDVEDMDMDDTFEENDAFEEEADG